MILFIIIKHSNKIKFCIVFRLLLFNIVFRLLLLKLVQLYYHLFINQTNLKNIIYVLK